MTSRIRCSCGRVYDPQKHQHCPDCGAESAVESVVVAEKVKPPAPPEPSRNDTTPAKRLGITEVMQLLKALRWPIYALPVVVALFILLLALRTHRSNQTAAAPTGGERASAPPHEETSPTQLPGESIPPQFPSGSALVGGGGNLNQLIANAGRSGTVKLSPGVYQGGVTVNRSVHIIGDIQTLGGQVMIQSEGKECLSVRAKGVTVQNIQFMCSGIGDLPAVSVADGADLEMENCKIQSTSGLGLSVTGNASIKVLGSTFTANNGTAVRLNQQAHGDFTQSSFSDMKIGLSAANAATGELRSCAFERAGMSDRDGAIMELGGDKTEITGVDCHFTNNSGGISARDKASVALTNCQFKDNAGLSVRDSTTTGLIVVRDSARAAIRGSSFANSSPYAVRVMSGGTLILEDTEISGSRTAGLVVGEQNGLPAHADVKRSHFSRNSTGIGIFGGGFADISDSECRENNEGIVVLDPGSRLKLTKTALVSNRDRGLYVYGGAEAEATDSQIENNGRGAQSGQQHKSSMRASLALENCRVAGNQIFGVGACSQSELSMNGVIFANNGKTNVYRESGAVVRMNTGSQTAEEQASASATPSADQSASDVQRSSRRKKARRGSDDAAAEILRRFLGRP